MTLKEAGESVPLASPGIAVIGPGAVPIDANEFSLTSDTYQQRSWFTRAPKILITGTRKRPYRHLGELVHTPLISIEEPENWEGMDGAIKQIESYALIVFTSRYAVQAFTDRLIGLGGDTRRLAKSRIAVVGRATAAALRDRGLSADVVALPETAAGLIDAINQEGSLAGSKVLLPRSQIADDTLPKELEDLGGEVTNATAYRTVPVKDPVKIDLSVCDAVLFSSPSTVRAFHKLYGTSLPDNISFWCLGPSTRAVAQLAFNRGELLP
jgi:uroporphyrinogen III methyltransferase/synthase